MNDKKQQLIERIREEGVTDLRAADLRGANLRGANLGDANLGDANLGDANLGDANLVRANLGGVNLVRANLRGANLVDAVLRGADLRRANLIGADLGDADLGDANLGDANLRDANLVDVNLRGANLVDAVLRGTYLNRARGIASFYIPRLSTRDDYIHAVNHGDKVMIKAGCYWDSVTEFVGAVERRAEPQFRNDLYSANALLMSVGLMAEDKDSVSEEAADAIRVAKAALMQAYNLLKENE